MDIISRLFSHRNQTSTGLSAPASHSFLQTPTLRHCEPQPSDDVWPGTGENTLGSLLVVKLLKMQLFEKVEKYRKPGTIISSNTSGIPIHMMLVFQIDLHVSSYYLLMIFYLFQ